MYFQLETVVDLSGKKTRVCDVCLLRLLVGPEGVSHEHLLLCLSPDFRWRCGGNVGTRLRFREVTDTLPTDGLGYGLVRSRPGSATSRQCVDSPTLLQLLGMFV